MKRTKRAPVQAPVKMSDAISRLIPSGLSKNDQALYTLAASISLTRAQYAQRLGKSYGNDRDLYAALGYPRSLDFQDYMARYERQDIARRIVDAPANACWRKTPKITDDESDKIRTPFEKAWDEMVTGNKIYRYVRRVDRISGIGQYGVLLLGFDDVRRVEDLALPVQPKAGRKLLYLRPYHEDSGQIQSFDEDLKSPRYGLPKTYKLNSASTGKTAGTRILSLNNVHYSRVIHVAEDLIEDDVYGTPRLHSVYNRLQDLELIAGGSSEMFWRGAFPGISFEMDPEADVSTAMISAMGDDIEDYVHALKRYMRLQGVTAHQLQVQVADPRGHLEILIGMIAAAKAMPKRILLGSERGELASSQDERQWNRTVDERRKDFGELQILRPLIDNCIAAGALPPPKNNEYRIVWTELDVPDEKEAAEIARTKMVAAKEYLSGSVDLIIPPEIFLSRILNYDRAEVESWLSGIESRESLLLQQEDTEIDDAEADMDEGDVDE